MVLYRQKLTTIFQKLTIVMIVFLFLEIKANEVITLGITGVALKENISTLLKLNEYLSQKTGLTIHIKFARSYSDMRHFILNHTVDVAYICGATYVDLIPTKKIKLLVLPTVDNKPFYYAYIISKHDTNYKSITDFHHTIFAMSDPESNSGSLATKYTIALKGYDNKKFFKNIIYTYDHGESIKAVLAGFTQGASVDSIVYKAFFQNHPKQKQKLKIVQKLGPFLIPPFIVNKNLSYKKKKKLQEALTAMNKDDIGKEILYALGIDGFIKPNNFSYEKIKKIKLYLSHKK